MGGLDTETQLGKGSSNRPTGREPSGPERGARSAPRGPSGTSAQARRPPHSCGSVAASSCAPLTLPGPQRQRQRQRQGEGRPAEQDSTGGPMTSLVVSLMVETS